MPMHASRFFLGWVAIAIVGALLVPRAARCDDAPLPDVIEFNRDVRPILSDNCYFCHGPDKNKRKANLRLDTHDGLLGKTEDGPVLVPGKSAEGELVRRITSADGDVAMPPADSGKKLTPRDIAMLKRWIDQGAKWEGHWAFQPIKRPTPPDVAALAPTIKETAGAFLQNPIDTFVLAEMVKHKLSPSAEADRRTLLRRLSLDLVGTPPTPEEVEAFVADNDPKAYEKVVDRLLASPRFGERLAMWWLDLVRYADTVGYHGDQPMSVWPYRDYVIRSLNENKRFDQFTVEQLAGDLLPNPTQEQKVASGYNRLGMMSAEGGVQPKEYLAKYIAERVRNVSGAWLGVTMGCCECHDHKYDPFLSKDFYRMEAFFADIEERGLYSGAEGSGEWGPRISLPSAEQTAELSRLDGEVALLKKLLDSPTPELAAAQAAWEKQPEKGKLPKPIEEILKVEAEKRNDAQRNELAVYYRSIAPALEPTRKQLKQAEADKATVLRQIPTTLVTVAVAPRTIRVLRRGNWMDESGEVVSPAMPGLLAQPPAADKRLTRLDLARWIVAADNPLTARVLVNRLWKLYFGAGLSRKLDDVGAQGEWPTHPLLLDYLAGQMIDSGWDLKGMVKSIVMSGAYRQSSAATQTARDADPFNRYLSRQNRYRLDAELVRDNALAISGLLVERLGGPSVKPYQPRGYWAYLNFPQREWENGKGEELYRRGLYTHWQRQYLHPSLMAFDAPSREECAADRPRSNTPLQSLVLLNDPSYVEAARAFAEEILRHGGATREARFDYAFRRATARGVREAEMPVLTALLEKHLGEYRADAKSVGAALAVGTKPVPADLDKTELAAWTSVARAILNLHETVTRN